MAMIQATRFCPTCNCQRLAAKDGCSHGLHLVLSLLTCGVWILIWILCGMASAAAPYRCQACGKIC